MPESPPPPSPPVSPPPAPRFHTYPHYPQMVGPLTPPPPPDPISPYYMQFATHSLHPPPEPVVVPGPELPRSRSEGSSAFRYSTERPDFSYPRTTSTSTVEITHRRSPKSSLHSKNNQKLPRSRSSQAERRRRSSSTTSPPPPPPPIPSDQPEELTSQLARTIPELRQGILELLSVVTKQEESPLVSSKSIIVEGGSSQAPNLTLKEHRMVEVKVHAKLKKGDVGGICKKSNMPPEALDFRLVKWNQQRRLLDLEFRRLLTWETRLRDEERHARVRSEYPKNDDDRSAAHDIKTMKDAFSSIGKTLVGVLKRDCGFGREVDCVKQLLQRDTRVDPPSKSQFQRQDDPLKSIQTAVDSLFGLLRPLKRTRDQPLRRSMFEFAYSYTASRRETMSLNLCDVPESIGHSESISGAIVFGQEEPQLAQTACSLLKAADSDASEEDKGRRVRRKPNTQSSDEQNLRDGGSLASSSRQETQHGKVDPEKKIVLKIADRANAFVEENCPPNPGTLSSSNEEARPRIRRIGTNEVEMVKKLDPEISELNELFSSLSFQTGFSSAGIVRKLRDLAQHEELNDGPSLLNFNPEASKSLHRLDSILALFTSLPDWQIYTMPDQKNYAMAAVSMIKYSLLEQVMGCAADFSQDLRSRLEKPAVSSGVQSELRFFCACIQRLSKLIRNINGDLQSQLEMITTNLMIVAANIGQSSTTKGKGSVSGPDSKGNKQESQNDAMIETGSLPTPGSGNSANAGSDTMGESDSSSEKGSSGIAEDFENEFRSAFSKYRPLALACYLESADEQGLDSKVHPTYVPSGLESLTVKDLFISSDVGMPDAV